MFARRFISLFLAAIITGGAYGFAMFSFGKSKTVYYAKSDEVLINPLSGYAPWSTDEDQVEKYSLFYVDVTWRELEPEEGVFDFDGIEEYNGLDRWRAAGKRVVFRFVLDVPRDYEHMDIPDWLYEATGGDGYKYNVSYGKGFSPNYANRIIINGHARAIKALGERYGGDDFFAFVELGSLGHWGEWHVKYRDGIPPLPEESVREEYVKPYLAAFPNSQILMRRPFTPVKTYGLGVYNDMTGNASATEDWLDWINNGGEYSQTGEQNALAAVPGVWNTAAVGGEFTSSHSMDWMLRFHLEDTLALIRSSHMVFIGPKIPKTDSVAEGAAEVHKNIGYRLRIKKAQFKGSYSKNALRVTLEWTNDGATPMYWDWDVYLYVIDSSGKTTDKKKVNIKLSELLPGKTVRTTGAVRLANPEENYKIYIGIEDPATGQPGLKLAMEGERLGDMTLLTEWSEKVNLAE